MNYHNITTNDMLNGPGLRVVLWVSGCNHHCKNCQNPQTWDVNSGIEFDDSAYDELMINLSKPFIKGITFSGGDPLNENNIVTIAKLCEDIRNKYGNAKDIWIYTGYKFSELLSGFKYHTDALNIILNNADVIVDGKFIEGLMDATLPWRGSSNQNLIYLKK